MNCNTTHYRANSSSVPGDPTDHVCDETGLLLDRGNEQISFIHLSFQEYLAAWVFLCDHAMPHGPSFFVEHLGDPAWEEVLLLRLYIVLREGGGVTRFDEILAAVLKALEQKSSPAGWLTLARAIRDDLEFSDHDRKEVLGQVLAFWLEEPAFESMWYSALEEVKLFAERARETLRAVIAEARRQARTGTGAIALLHLEARLFGFPDDAAAALMQRPDLGEMLADLVPFAEEPGIRELLADEAAIADWTGALRALDAPETYRMTVRWMTEAPAPAAAEAAAAHLWDKILIDLRSRATFAGPRRGHEDAVLFDQPGALSFESRFSSATLPYACLRALPVSLPGAVSVPAASLLCASLAKTRQRDAEAADVPRELTAWTERWSASQLDGFPATVPLDRDGILGFVRDFVRNFDRAFVRDSVRELLRDSVRDSVRDFGDDFGRGFFHDFVRHFFRDFFHDSIRRLVVPDRPEREKAWKRALEEETYQLRLLDHVDFWQWAWPSPATGRLDSHARVTALHSELDNPLALPLLLADLWSGAASHMFLASLRHAAAAYPLGNLPDDALESWLMQNPVDVYATALAWEEHCKALGNVSGASACLVIAHAAYASLMTGLECKLPFAPDLTDSRVRLSYLLYELCNFRDPEANVRKLEQEIASPAPELRPLLEAAGVLAPA